MGYFSQASGRTVSGRPAVLLSKGKAAEKPSSNVTVTRLCRVPSPRFFAPFGDSTEKTCDDAFTSICTNVGYGGWGFSN